MFPLTIYITEVAIDIHMEYEINGLAFLDQFLFKMFQLLCRTCNLSIGVRDIPEDGLQTITLTSIGYWYDEVTIDKGSASGIEKNMAVVNYQGLVGKVIKVSNHVSTVKLLANENTTDKVSVKIKVNDSYVYGLISKYDSKTNSYTVEGISENIEIPKDSEVVTTGMGDTFPSGLLIGKVTTTTTDNFDLSKVALVQSSVDFDNLNYVSILKRKDK